MTLGVGIDSLACNVVGHLISNGTKNFKDLVNIVCLPGTFNFAERTEPSLPHSNSVTLHNFQKDLFVCSSLRMTISFTFIEGSLKVLDVL